MYVLRLCNSLLVGKGRRQPKPTKPKKMIKLEGQHAVTSACNNGTSALVLQSGELYLFGKDTAHADHNTGKVILLGFPKNMF